MKARRRKNQRPDQTVAVMTSTGKSAFAPTAEREQQESSSIAAAPDRQRQLQMAQQTGFDFAAMPLFAPAAPVQAKLMVGAPHDRYEQEADRMADRVVAGEVNQPVQREVEEEEVQAKLESGVVQREGEEEEIQAKLESSAVQREGEEEEIQAKPESGVVQREGEEEEIQAKPESGVVQREEEEEVQAKLESEVAQREGEEEEIQAKAESGVVQCETEEEEIQAKAEPDPLKHRLQRLAQPAQPKPPVSGSIAAPPKIDLSPKDSGESMPDPVRMKMEQSFGVDLSGVRIHQGKEAKQIRALAFTRGNDIHFQPGRYQPDSEQGQKLLGHELTHVVQQRAGQVATPQGKGTPINADPKLESEADRLGAKAANGKPVQVSGASAKTAGQRKAEAVQREEEEEASVAGAERMMDVEDLSSALGAAKDWSDGEMGGTGLKNAFQSTWESRTADAEGMSDDEKSEAFDKTTAGAVFKGGGGGMDMASHAAELLTLGDKFRSDKVGDQAEATATTAKNLSGMTGGAANVHNAVTGSDASDEVGKYGGGIADSFDFGLKGAKAIGTFRDWVAEHQAGLFTNRKAAMARSLGRGVKEAAALTVAGGKATKGIAEMAGGAAAASTAGKVIPGAQIALGAMDLMQGGVGMFRAGRRRGKLTNAQSGVNRKKGEAETRIAALQGNIPSQEQAVNDTLAVLNQANSEVKALEDQQALPEKPQDLENQLEEKKKERDQAQKAHEEANKALEDAKREIAELTQQAKTGTQENDILGQLHEIQQKRQKRSGFKAVTGGLGMTAGILAATGVGAIPAAVLGGVGVAASVGRVAANSFKQWGRDKAARHQRNEDEIKADRTAERTALEEQSRSADGSWNPFKKFAAWRADRKLKSMNAAGTDADYAKNKRKAYDDEQGTWKSKFLGWFDSDKSTKKKEKKRQDLSGDMINMADGETKNAAFDSIGLTESKRNALARKTRGDKAATWNALSVDEKKQLIGTALKAR